MHRILILDSESPLRQRLAETLRQTANTEVTLAGDEEDLIAKAQFGPYAAVFADADLLEAGAARIIDAVRSSVTHPMLIIASNDKSEDLDPDLVTLVVRKPYDVLTLTGILLSAVMQMPGGLAGDADSSTVN